MAVRLTATGDPDPWYVTWAVETDLANFSALEHVNEAFADWVSAWDAALGTHVTSDAVIGRFGQDATDDLIVTSTLPPNTGNKAGQYLPQNCALLVRKNTGLGGRRNRGRFYVPGVLDETSVDNLGVINPTATGVLQGAATAFNTALLNDNGGTAPVMPMVILHTPDPVTGVVATPTPVTSLQVSNVIATQRRRLRK